MAKKDKILLVDDSTLIQKVGKQILFRKGFEVVLADHGEMALKLFFNQGIKLVILDYHMPKLNGLQTLHEIRTCLDPDDSKVPVLILSGEEDSREISKLLEAGANDYIYKGRLKSTPELFLEKVFTLLNYERQLAHYKKMKLARTLPEPIKDFYTFSSKYIEGFAAGTPQPVSNVEQQLETIYDLNEKGEILETIYEVIKPEAYLLTHTVNTSILAILFCSFLKMDRQKVLNIALGAFFHDFGNLEGEKPMLRNPSKLNEKDFEVYMHHVGKSIKVSAKLNLPPEAADFIENHHERLNGSGFPGKKLRENLSRVANIANLIVTFDALTSDKQAERKMLSLEAVRKMRSWKNQFPEELLDELENFSRQYEVKPKD